jgi:hypothetical protein
MTTEEAIYILKNSAFLSTVSEYQEVEEATNLAIKALEKQIPKKFKMKDDYTPICPVCGEEVWDMEYCDGCGQLLSDEAED